MTKKKDLQHLTTVDVNKLSEKELFKLKVKHDKWMKDAVKRCNDIHKPVEKK